MIEMSFTEFRKQASTSLDRVERGETIRIVRHGRPVADIVPVAVGKHGPSWKRDALRLKTDGASLSREVLAERYEADQ